MSYNFISYPKVDSAHLAVEVDGTFYAAVDAYTDAYSQVVPSTGTPGGDYSVFCCFHLVNDGQGACMGIVRKHRRYFMGEAIWRKA